MSCFLKYSFPTDLESRISDLGSHGVGGHWIAKGDQALPAVFIFPNCLRFGPAALNQCGDQGLYHLVYFIFRPFHSAEWVNGPDLSCLCDHLFATPEKSRYWSAEIALFEVEHS